MVLRKDHQTTKPRTKRTYIPHDLPKEGFVRRPAILKVLGICSTSLNNGIKAGKYPPGKLLSARTRVWSVVEIRELLAKIDNGAA